MKNLEIKTIEHKGVKVTVKIDYDLGKASLVERNRLGNFTTKNWIFQDRGLEYMNGWKEIIEAMAEAVKICKKDLEADLAAKSAFKEAQVAALLVSLENHD